MSGGSWDYLYQKIEEASERLIREGGSEERKAMGFHLNKIAVAMKAIEWVDSCDSEPGSEIAPLRTCLPSIEMFTAATLQAAEAAERLINSLKKMQEFGAEIQKFGNLKLPLGGVIKQ